MTTIDYLINAGFLLLIVRQARERELDLRSVVMPLVLVFFVGQMYIHTIPTSGNDLVLVAALAAVGLGLGIASGIATHIRPGEHGLAVARVGWVAGILLVTGIGSRMVFAFALSHGFDPTVRSFSMAHQIGFTAWPVALVSMAILEVTARLVIVQVRGRRLMAGRPAATASLATA
jgi:hypothetical protein